MYKGKLPPDSNALLLKEPGRSFTSLSNNKQKEKFTRITNPFPHDQPGSQPKSLNSVERSFLFPSKPPYCP